MATKKQKQKLKVKLFAHCQDDQSGGYDVTIYGTELEAEQGQRDAGWDGNPDNLDTYQHGEIDSRDVVLLVDEAGNVTFKEPIHFHVGQ